MLTACLLIPHSLILSWLRRVLVLERLSEANISQIQRDAIARIAASAPADGSDHSRAVLGIPLATDDVVNYITTLSDGDARTALNLLELVLQAPPGTTSQKIYATLKNTTMSRHAHDSKTDRLTLTAHYLGIIALETTDMI